jgi:hypothetical protein
MLLLFDQVSWFVKNYTCIICEVLLFDQVSWLIKNYTCIVCEVLLFDQVSWLIKNYTCIVCEVLLFDQVSWLVMLLSLYSVLSMCASVVGCTRDTYLDVSRVRRLARIRDPMLMGLQPSYSTSELVG